MFGRRKTEMPDAGAALPGRSTAVEVPPAHFVNGNPLVGPFPEGTETAVFGMGCFWGAERKFWQSAASSQPPSATKADSRHTQPMKRHVLQNGSHRSRHGCVRTERDLEGLPPLG